MADRKLRKHLGEYLVGQQNAYSWVPNKRIYLISKFNLFIKQCFLIVQGQPLGFDTMYLALT